MSRTDDDMVPIGQTPEWNAWFEQAFAEIARSNGSSTPLDQWRPIGIVRHVPDTVVVRDEPMQPRVETLALVRAHGQVSTINHFPYDFRP